MSRFIMCANGCGRPANEVGLTGDCPDCGKTLCEWCCDVRKALRAMRPSNPPDLIVVDEIGSWEIVRKS